MVKACPALTGVGVATQLVGFTVVSVPTGTSTPDLQTMMMSPSGASAGRVKMMPVPSLEIFISLALTPPMSTSATMLK